MSTPSNSHAKVLAAAFALLAIGAMPSFAEAQMGASVSAPLRHEIDRVCAPLDAAAEASNHLFARYVTAAHPNDTGWTAYTGTAAHPVNAATDEDATGSFAHVLARAGSIRAVFIFTPETQRRGEITSRYCYQNGRLARMRTTYQLREADTIWTRTRYFGDDGTFLTQTDEHHHILPNEDLPVRVPPLDEPTYSKPAALPFFRAFRVQQHR